MIVLAGAARPQNTILFIYIAVALKLVYYSLANCVGRPSLAGNALLKKIMYNAFTSE